MIYRVNIFFAVIIFSLFCPSGVFSQKLYFCEEYKDGKEIGVSETFIINPGGGYFTCMLDLRGTGEKIGSEKIALKIWKYAENTERKFEAEEKFDIQPGWDYIYFDKFHTFYEAGRYFVEAVLPDGSQVAVGDVNIELQDGSNTEKSSSSKLYFCERYEKTEIGISEIFYISPFSGGTFTAMLDLRDAGKTAGVNSLTLKIVKIYGSQEIFIAGEKFDIDPDWDYIYFSDFHDFKNAGKYTVTAVTPEGSVLGEGLVEVRVR